MRLRRLALAVGLASAFGTNVVSALGLGEIKLRSNLNQPLEAEIKLLEVRDLSENEILVGLASRDEFQRVGIERPFLLQDLKFEVDLNAGSGPIIRVSSRNPIREPYLNFLLESQWPNGRLLREYTVLLDLPVYAENRPAPSVSAARSTATQAPASAPRQSSSAAGGDSGGRSYGPVSATDTLWDIALRVRPDRSYSVHKTMLAIQRLNPDAFINGNINLLKRGQVLRVPAASEIDEVTQQQALNEVAYQNSNWTGDAGESSPMAAQLDATNSRSSDATGPAAIEGRLKVAGDSRDSVGGMSAGGMGSGGQQQTSGEPLSQQLSVSLEELDKARRENSDLKDRVSQLEEQLRTMERLVEVSSEEMRALQLQAASEGSEAEGSVEGAGPFAEAENESGAQAGSDVSAVDEAADADAAAAPVAPDPVKSVAEEKPKADPSKVVRQAPSKEKSWVDTLKDNILYIGGALVAILAAVLFLLKRKDNEDEGDLVPIAGTSSKREKDDDENVVASERAEANLPDETVAMAAAAVVAGAAAEKDDDLSAPEVDLELEDSIFEEPADDDSVTVETPVESQTEDVVGEADIYIAYGKLDQAKEMLLKALADDPGHTAARLKLMEVYAEDNDSGAFESEYATIAASGDEASIARADDLRMHFEDLDVPANEAEEFDLDLPDDVVAGSDETSTEAGVVAGLTEDADAADVENELSLDLDETDALELDKELSFDLEEVDSQVEDAGLSLELDEADQPDLGEELALDFDEQGEGLGLAVDEPQPLASDTTEEDADGAAGEEWSLDLAEDLSEPVSGEKEESDIEFQLDLDDLADESDEDGSLSDHDDFELSLDLEDDLEIAREPALLDDDELELKSDGATDFSLDFDEPDAEDAMAVSEVSGSSQGADTEEESELSFDALDEELDGALAEQDESFELDLGGEEDEEPLEFSLDESDLDLTLDESDLELEPTEQESDVVSGDENALEASEAEDGPAAELEALTDALVDDSQTLDDSNELSAKGDNEFLTADSNDVTLSYEVDQGLLDEVAGDDAEDPDAHFDLEEDGIDLEELDKELGALSGELDDSDDLSESEGEAGTQEADSGEPEWDATDLNADGDVFDEALADLPTPEDVMADASEESDLDDEFDFLADADEVATKLDLARAYIDMGDHEGARDILGEVIEEGNDQQRQDAQEMMGALG